MLTKGKGIALRIEEIEAITGVLAHYSHVEKAILYGSRAKGTAKPYSDIDIALKGTSLTYTDWARIHNDLDDLLLPYKIDITLYNDIRNEELRNHIDRVGIVIYERS